MAIHKILNYLIAAVWLINGLFCKVLNFVPRHQQIVAKILGGEYAAAITKIIGFLEIAMALWILSGRFGKLNALVQVTIIILMNILEYMLAPDFLLWGHFNIIFALLFSVVIVYNEFYLIKK